MKMIGVVLTSVFLMSSYLAGSEALAANEKQPRVRDLKKIAQAGRLSQDAKKMESLNNATKIVKPLRERSTVVVTPGPGRDE